MLSISLFLGESEERASDELCYDSFVSLADAKKHCETLAIIMQIECDGVVLQSDGSYAGVTGVQSSTRGSKQQEIFLKLRRIWKFARSLFTEKGKLVEVWSEERDGYYEGCAQVKNLKTHS